MPGLVINATPFGRPGAGNTYDSTPRTVTFGNRIRQFPGGGLIDGTKSRDPGNTGALTLLRAGLLMGKITASGKYATSVLGLTGSALTGASTTLTVPEAVGDEIVRRIGATGTFTLTGPPAASGVARQLTVTYSAVAAAGGGNRVITITALGVNQVEQINFNVASTGGNLQLNVQKTDGTFITTGNAAWSATDATYLSNINTALDTATGVVGGIVASAIPAVDTDLGIRLTYSGTGYAGLAWTPAEVALFPTTSTAAIYTPITTAVDGRMVTSALLGPTDGSQNPITFIPDGFGKNIDPSTSGDIEFPDLITEADVDETQLLNYPADTGLRTWLKNQLKTVNTYWFKGDH